MFTYVFNFYRFNRKKNTSLLNIDMHNILSSAVHYINFILYDANFCDSRCYYIVIKLLFSAI